jgi:hypothetical protein
MSEEEKEQLGDALYEARHAPKLTGMMLDSQTADQVRDMLADDAILKREVSEALKCLSRSAAEEEEDDGVDWKAKAAEMEEELQQAEEWASDVQKDLHAWSEKERSWNKEREALKKESVELKRRLLVVKVDLPFAIGKEIEGKDANGRWMHGVITEENPDGTLKMCLKEDNRIWPKVHKANTRPIPEFEIDESLEGMDENGKWFPIMVKGKNDDGTYACDVLRADGSIQRRWDKSLRRNMRHVQDFSEYPDAYYYGLDCNGKAWPVKITHNNDNGTYFCKVQDGHHTKWAEALRCNLW